MEIRAGTSGFQYKPWRGSFYPEKLAEKDMLAYYAERLPAVEINASFYRMPKREVVEAWAATVADGFWFVLKASQRITHFARLKPEAAEPLGYLLRVVEALGTKRGPLLFQLPPNMKQDVPRLRAFLALLPPEQLAAFEFRHESWFDEATYDALRERNVALVQADAEDATPARVATADWGYLRLRRMGYEGAELADWAAWVKEQAWHTAYAFFKHEDEGAGPRLAAEFLALAGAP